MTTLAVNHVRSRAGLEARKLTVAVALVVVANVAVSALVSGTDEAGLRAIVRNTVRLAMALFLVTFVASSLVTLTRTSAAKWLLRNRRSIGMSYAVAMAAHLAAFVALGVVHSASFWKTTPLTTVALGSAAYLVLIAMAVTSFDRPAAWLGRQRWRLLHKMGMYAFWMIFASTYAGRVEQSWVARVALAGLVLAIAIRAAARWRRRRRKRAAI